MDDNSFDAIEKAINSNDKLKDDLLALQRKATVDGWTTDEYAEHVNELLKQNDITLSPETLHSLVKDAGTELTDDELDQVAGGGWFSKNCNKRKECPDGTGRSCYPHC